ncbi:MAG: nucleotidyl transferase AbiEii/AbiGii toxin family protein [Bacteroidales bacterium]
MTSQFNIDFLPIQTQKVFEKLAEKQFINNYSLVGGTALSLQLKHRLSEDLDFVIDEEELSINGIKRNIAKIFPEHRIIRQDAPWHIDFIINEVKVTFFSRGAVAIPFNIGDYTTPYKNINICKIDVIATLKMASIAQRNTIRDYYDLYYLAKYHMSLLEIIEKTKTLIPNLSPITYSETLVYTDDIDEATIAEHLQPAEIVTKEQIATFFINELIEIKREL